MHTNALTPLTFEYLERNHGLFSCHQSFLVLNALSEVSENYNQHQLPNILLIAVTVISSCIQSISPRFVLCITLRPEALVNNL